MENEQAVNFDTSVISAIGTGSISNEIPEVIDYEPDFYDELEYQYSLENSDSGYETSSR